MSSYTIIEIKTENINLTDNNKKVLENIIGSCHYKFEGFKNIIKENYLEYYKAFNNDFEKAIELLKVIQSSAEVTNKAIKIGELESESYNNPYRDIYLYKSKIYLIYFDVDYLYKYYITDLNLNYKCIVEDERIEIEQVIEKYLIEITKKV